MKQAMINNQIMEHSSLRLHAETPRALEITSPDRQEFSFQTNSFNSWQASNKACINPPVLPSPIEHPSRTMPIPGENTGSFTEYG